MYEDEMMEDDILETTTEDGEAVKLRIIDYFFYNGQEYAILSDVTEEDEESDELECFVMKVETAEDEDGEEYEDFLPIEDEKLEEKLMEVATLRLNEDEEEE